MLEEGLGRKAEKELLPAQPGDVAITHADISAIRADHGYAPTTPLAFGFPTFARWFLGWRAGQT